MAKYRVLKGAHALPNPEPTEDNMAPVILRGRGQIVESDKDLVKKFGADKFELVQEAQPVVAPPSPAPVSKPAPAVEPSAAKVVKEPQGGSDELAESSLGDNVTDEFPSAVAGGLLVFRKGASYFVTEADEPEKALNDTKLTQKKVAEFIAEQVAG